MPLRRGRLWMVDARIDRRKQLLGRQGGCSNAEHGAKQIVRIAEGVVFLRRAGGMLELMRDRGVLREQQRDDEERAPEAGERAVSWTGQRRSAGRRRRSARFSGWKACR